MIRVRNIMQIAICNAPIYFFTLVHADLEPYLVFGLKAFTQLSSFFGRTHVQLFSDKALQKQTITIVASTLHMLPSVARLIQTHRTVKQICRQIVVIEQRAAPKKQKKKKKKKKKI